jgi:Ca2+-transporting ATPase
LTYVTAIHVPIAGLALGPILLGFPPLLLPMHVVLLELAVDPLCSLVFEAEASEPGAMRRPPREAREMLFGPRQLALGLLQGVVVLAVVLGFYGGVVGRVSEPEARGAGFAALILANLTLANVDALSEGVRVFSRRRLAFWVIATSAVVVLGAVLGIPAIAGVFDVAPPPPPILAAAVAAALAAGGWLAPVRMLDRLGKRLA